MEIFCKNDKVLNNKNMVRRMRLTLYYIFNRGRVITGVTKERKTSYENWMQLTAIINRRRLFAVGFVYQFIDTVSMNTTVNSWTLLNENNLYNSY